MSRRNDEDIDVWPLSSISLFKWENEKWQSVTLSANYAQNDRHSATPYFLVPVNKGKHSVYVECQGFQGVKSIGGKADGCWTGIIAYNADKDGWAVQEYAGVYISNYQTGSNVVCAHPDVELNGCKFKEKRGVEYDFYCSFHLDSDDGYFALRAPPIQKDSDFNYIVSYGGYTDKTIEWGSVSISIDEVDNQSKWLTSSPRRDIVRRREWVKTMVSYLSSPPRERKPEKTPDLVGPSKLDEGSPTGTIQLFSDDELSSGDPGDYPGDYDWGDLDPRSRATTPKGSEGTPTYRTEDVQARPPSRLHGTLNSTIPSFKPEPTLISDPTESVPNTEDVMRMQGVYTSDRAAAQDVTQLKRDKSFMKKLMPSLGGSSSSKLQGGVLRQKLDVTQKKYMTSEELRIAGQTYRGLGETALKDYIAKLKLYERVPGFVKEPNPNE